MSGKPPTRRRFLKGAAAVTLALLTTGSVVALVRTRGYAITPDRERKRRVLSVWHYVLLDSVAARICAPDAPDKSIPTCEDVDVVGFIDGYVASMHRAVRRDLFRLFAFVEHLAPVACGFSSRFSRLVPAEQDRVLSYLESHTQDLLRGGFDGLKSLVFMGYYRDPRTWRILGYDGPTVGRPSGGW